MTATPFHLPKFFCMIFVASFSVFGLYKVGHWSSSLPENEIKVLLAYHPSLWGDYGYTVKAYESILQEEGVSFQSVGATGLLALPKEEVMAKIPAIVFPDQAAQILPDDLKLWLKDYVQKGGNVLIVYDAGSRNCKGQYLEEGLFSELVGFNYIQYKTLGDEAYTEGQLKITDQASQRFLEIPSGKLSRGDMVSGYFYGDLIYPTARNKAESGGKKGIILASTITRQGQTYPAIVLRSYGLGWVLYVNLPLGHLKSFSDDLLLRMVLRSFLFKVVKMPHLVNTARGVGGLVINWHIDANLDWESLPWMVEHGYLREGMECSLHITAGEYRDTPKDGLGFDACGQGGSLVKLVQGYGVIGSHGGWAHNCFAAKVASGSYSQEEIDYYIRLNNDCLTRVSGNQIREYSAPNGVHPQPETTKVLENLGLGAYYYTGDTGSSPNRTFSHGVMVSDSVIAFPIMPFQECASFGEMKAKGRSEIEVETWLKETVDYVIENRSVRLIYSHPYDLPAYSAAFSSFLDYLETKQREGQIAVRSMSYFADFLRRFLKTECRFIAENKGLRIELRNPAGLDDLTIAIPRLAYKLPDWASAISWSEQGSWRKSRGDKKAKDKAKDKDKDKAKEIEGESGSGLEEGLVVEEDRAYYYLTIKDEYKEKQLFLEKR